ncbi:MAG: hypothetical protein ABFS12_17570, partial [Bacteroidota bacterium]
MKTKHKLHIYLFLFFLLPLSILAQQHEKDSLFGIWLDTTLTSHQRLDAFNKVLKTDEIRLNTDNIDTLYSEVYKAIALAKNTGKGHLTPKFLNFATTYQIYEMDSLELGCETAEKTMDKALEHKDYFIIMMISRQLLNKRCLEANSKYSEASVINILDTIKKQLSSDIELLEYNKILAVYHTQRLNFHEALTAHRKVVEFHKNLDTISTTMSYSLQIMGIVHMRSGNYSEAYTYMKQSISINKTLKNTLSLGSNYVDITNVSIGLENYDEAFHYNDTAIAVLKEQANCEDPFYITLTQKARILSLQNFHQEALELLFEYEDYYNKPNMPSILNYSFYYVVFATVYFGLKNYSKAITSAKKSLEYTKYSKGSSYLANEKINYKILYQSWEKLGNYANSLKAYKNYVEAKDSMAMLFNSQKVTSLELENIFQKERYTDSLNVAKKMLANELEFQQKLKK